MTLRDLLGKLGYSHLTFILHPGILNLTLADIRDILSYIIEDSE